MALPESRLAVPDLKRILLASPRGFCAGVVRAIEIVDLALDCFDGPVFVRREIVHNRHVVRDFEARGVRFVQELDEVPDGATAVFSAHGVSPQVREQAVRRGLRVIDATCPLVTKVHLEAVRFAKMGYEILLVGHANHEEVEGTMGEAATQIRLVSTVDDAESIQVRDPQRVALITQTTLSMEDTRPIVETLRRRFPEIHVPAKDDICYATQNRQVAVRALAKQAPVILVVGSRNSSNSNRLVEEAQLAGARSYLVDDVTQIDPAWLAGVGTVGITSGASAPEFLVAEIVRRLGGEDAVEVEEVETVAEDVHFPLPPEVAGVEARTREGSSPPAEGSRRLPTRS
jgi:4-hydroxy-3-methylbut-2-enyl diphosphate reductase